MASSETNVSEPAPAFYHRGTRHSFFGNLYWHNTAAIVYVGFAIFPVMAVLLGEKLDDAEPTAILFWALVTSTAYPVWAWKEFHAFEAWVRKQPENTRARERAYFASVTAIARNFWAAVLATYTIAGVWQLALNAARTSPLK